MLLLRFFIACPPRRPLIEKASDRDHRSTSKVCPEAFPIKASDHPEVTPIVEHKGVSEINPETLRSGSYQGMMSLPQCDDEWAPH
jgi:hypothetical protein